MTPKIIIERAGPQYEKQLVKVEGWVMPEDAVYEEKIEKLKAAWEEWQHKVFAKLAEITTMEWQEADIRCYVVSGTRLSFSHPLTLRLLEEEVMFDTLVHELMHRLLNTKSAPQHLKDARKQFLEPYAGEPTTVRHHIILHALHAQLALELFGEERMRRIMSIAANEDYARAWSIVKERGREQILKEVFGYEAT